MIKVNSMNFSKNSFEDLLAPLDHLLKVDGADNLKQAIYLIDTYKDSTFTDPQKKRLQKIKEVISSLLNDLYSEKRNIENRKEVLASILKNQ